MLIAPINQKIGSEVALSGGYGSLTLLLSLVTIQFFFNLLYLLLCTAGVGSVGSVPEKSHDRLYIANASNKSALQNQLEPTLFWARARADSF